MTPFRLLDLFSGIGGFSLGLERSGAFKTVAFCEIEPFPRAVLAKHWPDVPCYDDVRTLSYGRLSSDGIEVDAICGGFPCQDISFAGKGAGITGERSGLWAEFSRLIGEIRPKFVIVENVTALLGRGISNVLGDLASLGYDAEWNCIPASYIGAPHRRDRVWIIAYPDENGLQIRTNVSEFANKSYCEEGKEGRSSDGIFASSTYSYSDARNKELGRKIGRMGRIIESIQRNRRWEIISEPTLGRGTNGIPNRVDRCGCLGNAVVPQIPEIIGRAIMERAL